MNTKKIQTLTTEVESAEKELKTAMGSYIKARKELSREAGGGTNLASIKSYLITLIGSMVK
jgi:hypothetical protein